MKFSRKAKRELALIVIAVAVLLFGYTLVFGRGGYLDLQRNRAELHAIQIENQRLKDENQTVLHRIRKLKSDPREIERIAREEFNLARPGDVIITLPNTSTGSLNPPEPVEPAASPALDPENR